MSNLSRPPVAVNWFLQLEVAGILLQTLFFKFTGAEESVYIFSAVGRFVHFPVFEPSRPVGNSRCIRPPCTRPRRCASLKYRRYSRSAPCRPGASPIQETRDLHHELPRLDWLRHRRARGPGNAARAGDVSASAILTIATMGGSWITPERLA